MPTLTQGQVYAVAVIVGLPQAKLMAAIAMAESSGRTGVVNSIGCVGLWQINQPVHVKANPKWTKEYLANPFNNAAAAKKILKAEGLKAWEAYTNGNYRKYMDTDVAGASLKPKDLGMTEPEFEKAIKGQPGVLDRSTPDGPLGSVDDAIDGALGGIADATGLGGIADVLSSAYESITTPAFWMRIAYGLTGVVLIVGGLALIVRNSPAFKQAAGVATNLVPGGAAVKAAASAKAA